MEWLIVAGVVIVVLALLSSGSKKKYKKIGLKVADFVPSEKDSDGNWCTYSTALKYIELFSVKADVHKDAQKLYKSEFDRLISEYKRQLQAELAENDDNLKGHIEHLESQLAEAEGDDIADIKSEIKEMQKAHKKIKDWVEKNLASIESDCRQPLRKLLTAAKKAWNEGPECYAHLEIDYEPPEIPDSYYY